MARVLIVDDESSIRGLLRQAFEMNGFEVVEASNGTEAVRTFGEGGIDLVITDIIMPDKEGLESIMDLKEIDPDVKIIAMSGGGRLSLIRIYRWLQNLEQRKCFKNHCQYPFFLKQQEN